ncbi:hypothetical protein F5883DRAFT_714493 [Diaporthe sp. PMI_573]|nr:hypothetical protein F5883DRAFT_714493 [Diaporthaceae sp. PMI_573]
MPRERSEQCTVQRKEVDEAKRVNVWLFRCGARVYLRHMDSSSSAIPPYVNDPIEVTPMTTKEGPPPCPHLETFNERIPQWALNWCRWNGWELKSNTWIIMQADLDREKFGSETLRWARRVLPAAAAKDSLVPADDWRPTQEFQLNNEAHLQLQHQSLSPTGLCDVPIQNLNQGISAYAGSGAGPSLYPDVVPNSTPLEFPTVEAMTYVSQMSYDEYTQEPPLDSLPGWDYRGGVQDHSEVGQGASISPSWPSILEEMAIQTSLEVGNQQSPETPTSGGSIPVAKAGAAASRTEARGYALRGTSTGMHKYSKNKHKLDST